MDQPIGVRPIGLVGCGAVPQRLMPILDALGCNVLFYSRSRHESRFGRQVTLPALLSASDIVSLHVPSTPETHHLIDAEALARMKPGAVLINTARGEIVDEQALVQMLDNGHISAAGLDVFENEPVEVSRELFRCPTVTVTPHVAWLTFETIERSLEIIEENVRRMKTGAPILHQVL